MKLIVYSSNTNRFDFLKNTLEQKTILKNVKIICIDDLSILPIYMDIFEYSLYGIILDLEDLTKSNDYMLKLLHNNIKILNEKPKTAVILNKNVQDSILKHIEDDFDICKKYTSFEELLFNMNDFFMRCKTIQKYKYKLIVKNEKCCLKEYFDNVLTGIKIPVISYKDNVLTIKIDKSYSRKLVVCIVKRILSDKTNIVNIFGYILEIRFKYNNKIYTFNDSMSTKDMLDYIM